MTARKNAPKPITAQPEPVAKVTQPAVPADVAFGNMIIGQRDNAVIEMQSLQSQLLARNALYERDLERLNTEYQAEAKSLTEQIGEQTRISQAADAALEALKENENA